MRKVIAVLALLPFTIGAFAQDTKPSIQKLDEKNGFRDMKFGADSSTLEGRKFFMTSDGVRYYIRPTDDPKIGGSTVQIYYGFYKGRLLTVGMTAPDKANGQALFDALVATYGVPIKPNQYVNIYYWYGGLVNMSYDASKMLRPQVFIVSRPLTTQAQADKAAAAKRASSDL
ncbi:hypothetical protein [Hymenobacter sp. BT491]|uniref:hypothetical protein n=1 Tax=Hymenobacter sp. BT491 TaxID=2766779 RepID=UPI001653ECA5|nr:hypothetical protein [Hymenobacter sp. BT491]MBC6991941.1 hypothetical protein [Hymenobacter sp. BT491]